MKVAAGFSRPHRMGGARRRRERGSRAERSWSVAASSSWTRRQRPGPKRRTTRRKAASPRWRSASSSASIVAAHTTSARVEIERLVERLRQGHHESPAAAILVGAPMADWSVDGILAVHVRMHQAEGAMFHARSPTHSLTWGFHWCRCRRRTPQRKPRRTGSRPSANAWARRGGRIRSMRPQQRRSCWIKSRNAHDAPPFSSRLSN